MTGLELYRWQKECLEAWEKNAWRGIVHVITGAGKTMCAMTGIRVLEERLRADNPSSQLRVRVVAPTIAIARQWVQGLRRFFQGEKDREIGVWYGGQKDSPDCFCMVYVVNSARHSLPNHVSRDMEKGIHVYLICDECHHYTGDENRKIFDFRQSRHYADGLYHAMGLSATPQCARYDAVLVPALGHEISWDGLREAVYEGQVSPFLIYQISVAFTGDEAQRYAQVDEQISLLQWKLLSAYPLLKGQSGMAFFMKVIQLAKELDDPDSLPQQYLNQVYLRRHICISANNRLRCAASLIRRLPKKERIILFCEKIEQTERIVAYMRKLFPNQVGVYHSKMPGDQRRQALRDFSDGMVRILATCKALDEGVDVPDASIGIVISSTMTNRQRIQRLGRVLRRAEGKMYATLYYLYINDDVDESRYLPDEEDPYSMVDLNYLANEDAFDCDFYTYLAARVVKRARKQGIREEVIWEFRRCMEQGVVLPDWMNKPEVLALSQSLIAPEDIRGRNMLIAMKRIAQERILYDIESHTAAPEMMLEDLDAQEDAESVWLTAEEKEEAGDFEVQEALPEPEAERESQAPLDVVGWLNESGLAPWLQEET